MYYENFKTLCENADVTPGEVSRHTGVASSTLTMWKQGVYTPKVDKLQKIADYFGVSLNYLQTGEEQSGDHFITEDVVNVAEKIKNNQSLQDLFDVIIKIDGNDIKTTADLHAYISRAGVGGVLKLTICRDGEELEIEVLY